MGRRVALGALGLVADSEACSQRSPVLFPKTKQNKTTSSKIYKNLGHAHQLHPFPQVPAPFMVPQPHAIADSATRGSHHRSCFSRRWVGKPWGCPGSRAPPGWKGSSSALGHSTRSLRVQPHVMCESVQGRESAGVSTQQSWCSWTSSEWRMSCPLSIRAGAPGGATQRSRADVGGAEASKAPRSLA